MKLLELQEFSDSGYESISIDNYENASIEDWCDLFVNMEKG